MQQIVVIHGGDAFDTYEEYLQSLREKEISLERMRAKDWKGNLGRDLGDGFDVLAPRMPNSQNARYAEWKMIFDKIAALLDNEVILIGHSLGGLFLAKYLAENSFPKQIKATILLAPPFTTPENPIVDFVLPEDLALLQQQGGKILLYQSSDDPVVNPEDIKQYAKKLPEATLREFSDRGHFNQESLPEIIEDIKGL